MDPKPPKPSAQELLADWRTAERVGKTARSAAESAGSRSISRLREGRGGLRPGRRDRRR